MPYKTMSEKNREDAQNVIRDLGISSIIVDISPIVDAFKEIVEDDDRRRLGSKMVRERMSMAKIEGLSFDMLIRKIFYYAVLRCNLEKNL